MSKLILGLAVCTGLSLAGLYLYEGLVGQCDEGGGCCHSKMEPVLTAVSSCDGSEGAGCCSVNEAVPSCCKAPSRATAISKAPEANSSVEVLTILPREKVSN